MNLPLTNLGYMYAHGEGGLMKDLDKAIELYRKAAELGNKKAKENLSRLGVE